MNKLIDILNDMNARYIISSSKHELDFNVMFKICQTILDEMDFDYYQENDQFCEDDGYDYIAETKSNEFDQKIITFNVDNNIEKYIEIDKSTNHVDWTYNSSYN